MRRTLSSISSGVGSLTHGVGSVVSGVGTLSAAVSTTMLNLATADEDLDGFEEPDFASDLKGRLDKEFLRRSKRSKKKHREKELSVDSGVATDPLMQDGQYGSDQEDYNRTTPPSKQDQISSNSCSSISLSSVDDEFIRGLSFVTNQDDQGGVNGEALAEEDEFVTGLSFKDSMIMHVYQDSGSSVGGRDEITHVTDDEDILTSSDRRLSESSDRRVSEDLLTSTDDEEFSLGTVDITATEVFLARKRKESAESRTIARSLNNSGNLSDLRRSTNDLSLTPRPLSSTTRSKSTLTLSPLNTSDESTYRRHSSLDKETVRSRSEVALNTILEREDQVDQRSVRYNNYVEISHQDPTTIESFDSSSGREKLEGSDYRGSSSDYDADEDLIEKKDPFRESFIGGRSHLFTSKQEEQQFSPTSCVKRKTLQNFNVGPGPCTNIETGDKSVIETISEISSKSQKSCTIVRKSQVKLKPLPKINAQSKTKSSLTVATPSPSTDSADKLSKSSIEKFSEVQPHVLESPTSSKRKNLLKPPSQSTSTQRESLNRFKDSPRSLTQRSNSCTNLNSKTEEILTRSGTLDGFNSLDKTRSYADLTYTPGNFTTESSPTADIAEKSVTLQNSSLMLSNVAQSLVPDSSDSIEESYRAGNRTDSTTSTFYSFSTEEPEPPKVILNGKSSKSFMTSMRNSFKKLASFLSLSKNKDTTLKHPVPPPQHTKPEQGIVVMRNRQCVRPTSPALAEEFKQRSKSCANLQNNSSVELDSSPGDKYRESNEFLNGADVDETPKLSHQNRTPRKALGPPSPLMSHINHFYSKADSDSNRFSSVNNFGFRNRTPRRSTPALYKSSPGTLLPSPPAQRKPHWRETKASRLRLNRVKVPSMSTLNL